MTKWYARTVWAVTDMDASLDFYVGRFGFKKNWKFEQDGERVEQVSREGCEIILSNQWPDTAGSGMMFVSLDPPVFAALQEEIEEKGIVATEGQWGYRLLIVADPDGNQLWYPFPDEDPVE